MVLRNNMYLNLRRMFSGIIYHIQIRINIVVSGLMNVNHIRYIVCMCTAYDNIV